MFKTIAIILGIISTINGQGTSGGGGGAGGGGASGGRYSGGNGEELPFFMKIFFGGVGVLLLGLIIRSAAKAWFPWIKFYVNSARRNPKKYISLDEDVQQYLKMCGSEMKWTGTFTGTSEINIGDSAQNASISLEKSDKKSNKVLRFTGNASDRFGKSTLDGFIDPIYGIIGWYKKYPTHTVQYYGQIDCEKINRSNITISGTWVIDEIGYDYDTGTFKLRHEMMKN